MKVFLVCKGDSENDILTPAGVAEIKKTADLLKTFFAEHHIDSKRVSSVHSNKMNTIECADILFKALGFRNCFEDAKWLEEHAQNTYEMLMEFCERRSLEYGYDGVIVISHHEQIMNVIREFSEKFDPLYAIEDKQMHRGAAYVIDLLFRNPIEIIYAPFVA